MVLCKKSKPKYGDKKYKFKFAWFPVFLDDGTLIWLEKYYEEWEYTVIYIDTVPVLGWSRNKRVSVIEGLSIDK